LEREKSFPKNGGSFKSQDPSKPNPGIKNPWEPPRELTGVTNSFSKGLLEPLFLPVLGKKMVFEFEEFFKNVPNWREPFLLLTKGKTAQGTRKEPPP